MRFFGLLLFILYSVVALAQDTEYLVIHRSIEKPLWQPFELTVINQQGKILRSVNTGIQHGLLVEHGFSEGGEFFWILQPDNKRHWIHIYNSKDLKLIKRLEIGQPASMSPSKGGFPSRDFFLHLSADGEQFVALTKKRSKKFLQVFDVPSASLELEQPLGKGRFRAQFSLLKNYVITSGVTGNRRKLHVIDLQAGVLSGEHGLGSYDVEITPGEYHYMVQLQLPEQNGGEYRAYVRALASTRQVIEPIASQKPIGVYMSQDLESDLIAYQPNQANANLTLFRLSRDGELTQLLETSQNQGAHIIRFLENERRYFIAGRSQFLIGDLDSAEYVSGNAGFDISEGFFSQNGDHVYFREGTGSEVAVHDALTGSQLGRTGTGRTDVKVAKVLMSVTYTAVGLYTGYYFGVSSGRNDTAMLLENGQRQLFVINAFSDDVTSLNANDLSVKKKMATGSGTFLVTQLPGADDHLVYTFSNRFVSVFAPETGQLLHKQKIDQLIGFDVSENLVFNKSKEQLQLIMPHEGTVINVPELNESFIVHPIWNHQTE